MPTYDEIGQVSDDLTLEGQCTLSTTISNGRTSPVLCFNPYYTGRPRTPLGFKSSVVDREEIIRRIKSREDRSRPTSPELERQSRATYDEEEQHISERLKNDNMEIGMQIERPKSALHRGDFRDKDTSTPAFEACSEMLATSPPAPWHSGFPATTFRQAWHERRHGRREEFTQPRSVSNTVRFQYCPPTSPLAQSSRPDTPPPHLARSSRSPDKSRRHTYSPHAFQHFASDIGVARSREREIKPTLRKEATYPYQAHQPRRSLHITDASPMSTWSSRRPSITSDARTPLHHAPMVGSYEESILRGRMSTTPSKPLNFVAQIGVLGKGKCKAQLRCPPHVVVPFPAVFYSYGVGQKQALDQPSPYVGLVDIENGLPSNDDADHKTQRSGEGSQTALVDGSTPGSHALDSDHIRRVQKVKRRSGSPKAPPGGSYRIPQQGQLQIVIKNPNKTAVKLFLIPYDLTDMLPGQKTFIRQRSYSAGPIIDMPLSSRRNLGTDRPEASLPSGEDPSDRPVLRYLVHVHICCTSRGRYWLYKSIRVVFANRVPDGKEKLRNEIQLPEPRYSSYRPGREHYGSESTPNSPSTHTTRRSGMDYLSTPMNRTAALSLPNAAAGSEDLSLFQFPSRAPPSATLESRPSSRHTQMDIDSDNTRSDADVLSLVSSSAETDRPVSITLDDPFVFERDDMRDSVNRRNGESLLSHQLRQLDM